MPVLIPPIRRAQAPDGAALAALVNYAGEGLAHYLWSKMAAPGEDPWEVGRRRQEAKIASAEVFVVDQGDGVIAGLTGYAVPAEPEPIPDDMDPMFRPLQELENLAPSTWYVNVLAVMPDHRGQGWGNRLLDVAEACAVETGTDGLSIIVADRNDGAFRLYAKRGYVEYARRPMLKEGWQTDSNEFVLLTRPAT